MWRLKANGGDGALNNALDPTFDTDGHVSLDSGGDERPTGLAVQPDGRIVVAGNTDNAPHSDAAVVWRLTSVGALDTTFDTDGAAAVDSGGFARADAVALQPDGKILLAGTTKLGAGPLVAAVWRLLPDGGTGAINAALDPTFNTGGTTTVPVGPGSSAGALALQPDRRIVVAGGRQHREPAGLPRAGRPVRAERRHGRRGCGLGAVLAAGIACAPTCTRTFDDGVGVTLTATPAAGSTFGGWSGGGCSGTGTCAVTMSSDQTVTATFNPVAVPSKHFVLKAKQLSMKAFRRNARKARASITGLPASTQISATLVAGHTTLARSKAKAGKGGRGRLTFTFSKKARRKLRSAKLKTVTFKVTVTPPGDTASKASRKVKLKRAR